MESFVAGLHEVINKKVAKASSQIAPRTSQEARSIQVFQIEVIEIHNSPRGG